MFKVLTLNNIAVGLRRLPRERFEVASEIASPDAIILRSHNMHDMDVPASVAAIGRAGAGTNNIPVAAMSQRGVPVFNAPGANANAVKELAIVEVANAALSLGMKVIGFDPKMTVRNAWQLSSGVQQAETLDQLFQNADAVSCHVPLVEATKGLVNRDRLALMNNGGLLINFARGGVVDNDAAVAALDSGKLHAYICDFPTPELIAHPKAVALPHLGASTGEAEENCAIMVAENVKDYLENGNIRHSVNFPECRLPRTMSHRITIANANVPNMVGQISTCLADAGLNIEDLLNKSAGEVAYTIVDVNGEVTDATMDKIRSIEGVLTMRNLGKPVS